MNGQTEDTKVEVMFRGCETKEMGRKKREEKKARGRVVRVPNCQMGGEKGRKN